MKKVKLLSGLILLNNSVLFAETVTTSSYKSVITSIYMQSVMIAILLALLTIVLVGFKNYDLIDSRIRKQKDVLVRRVIFFGMLTALPILWFFTTSSFMYNAIASRIMFYNWSPGDAWIGAKLLEAYTVAGTIILTIGFIMFYTLLSWLFTKFGKYKAWTVVYSNHKIFGKFSLNNKKK